MDYVQAVDKDSIARLDQKLKDKYGAGNYSLEDSIPVVARTLYSVKVTSTEGVVTNQEITSYIPRTEFGVGKDFINTYILDKKETHIYEFGASGEVLNVRTFIDIYDRTDPKKYTRTLQKSEYLFDGNRITDNNNYVVNDKSENSWDLVLGLKYIYNGDGIDAVTGNGYQLKRNYTGGRLSSITLNGGTISCVMDNNGYCTKLDYGNGRFMEMTYEPGTGDFENLYRLDELQKGIPVIY